jgi:hypothetical protein
MLSIPEKGESEVDSKVHVHLGGDCCTGAFFFLLLFEVYTRIKILESEFLALGCSNTKRQRHSYQGFGLLSLILSLHTVFKGQGDFCAFGLQ